MLVQQEGEDVLPLDAILTALLIRFVFHLPLRALEGFLSSLVLTLGLCLQIPSYSQICRRSQLLGKDLQRISKRKIPDSNEILFVKLTDNKTPDHIVYPQFMEDAPKTVKRTYGDGAYDRVITEEALLKLACTDLKCFLEEI